MVALSPAVALFMLLPLQAPASLPLTFDFEPPFALGANPGLAASGDTDLALEPREAGRCLKLSNRQPGRYTTVTLNQPFELVKNVQVSFDCRAAVVGDGRAGYVGILAYSGDKQFFGSVPFSSDWASHTMPLIALKPVNGGEFAAGMTIDRVNLYGRANGDEQILMQVWLDNVRVEVRAASGRLTDQVRVSNSNPPLFDWPDQPGPDRVAWSRDPAFPDGATTVVDADRHWLLPEAPLDPGRWYWRYALSGALSDGWSDITAVEIGPRAHRYAAGRVPADLATRPHPRLPVAPVAAADRSALKKSAQGEFQAGVPDEIPIWVEGDPRWPTWIEWYGLVHGNLTSRAGSRLQRLGDLAARLQDPEVDGWCAELALKAAGWDPEGGSAMHRGDIGAHHLLRGLVHCYDALAARLPAERLAPLKAAIVARANQFVARLLPFRGNEYNNHAWLQAFGLAEAGLVLAGDHEPAADWAQYCLDLYVGRFLCALGYDGDNNEGIGYWGYGLSFVVPYAEMMRDVCGVNLFEHPWLAQTGRFPLYTAVPHQHAVSFADTTQPNHGVVGPAATSQVRGLGLACRDPYALWYAGVRGPIDGLAPKPPVDLPPSKAYGFIGWAVCNTDLVDGRDGVTVAMRSGPFYAGHQHEDLNAFVIHAYGEPLAIDGGHYDWYGSPQFTKWSTLTRAHNTLLIDGLDQNSRRNGANGRLEDFLDAPSAAVTVGWTGGPMVYDGRVAEFRRRLLFLKPGLVITHDYVKAAQEPVRIDWLCHTIGELVTDGPNFRCQVGETALRGAVVTPVETALTVTTGYPADAQPVDRYSTRPSPPERTPLEYHLAASRPAAARHDILVAMAVSGTALETFRAVAVDTQGGVGAEVVTDGQVATVVSQSEAEAGVFGGGLRTDGTLAARIVRADGTTVRMMLDGTVLRDGDDWSIMADGPLTAIVEDSPAGRRIDLTTDGPRALLLQAGKVWLDGAPATLAGGRLPLPAGRHTIIVAPTADAMDGHAVPGLRVEHGDRSLTLDGYASRLPAGFQVTHWGCLDLPRPELVTIAADGPLQRLVIDGRDVGLGTRVTLAAGPHFLLARHDGGLRGLTIAAADADAVAAVILRAGATPERAVWVEAEQPVAEGGLKGTIMDKVAASGGKAHCVWDTDGQWAEWDLTVPHDGTYRLLLRAAGDDGEALRAVSLDGRPLSAAPLVRLAPTGGWCRDKDDWRTFEVPRDLALTAGPHRLRLERLTGSLNLDWLGLRDTKAR